MMFNELALIFQLMSTLMKKGYISYKETREILWETLPEDMPEGKKKKIIDNLVRKVK